MNDQVECHTETNNFESIIKVKFGYRERLNEDLNLCGENKP